MAIEEEEGGRRKDEEEKKGGSGGIGGRRKRKEGGGGRGGGGRKRRIGMYWVGGNGGPQKILRLIPYEHNQMQLGKVLISFIWSGRTV